MLRCGPEQSSADDAAISRRAPAGTAAALARKAEGSKARARKASAKREAPPRSSNDQAGAGSLDERSDPASAPLRHQAIASAPGRLSKHAASAICKPHDIT